MPTIPIQYTFLNKNYLKKKICLFMKISGDSIKSEVVFTRFLISGYRFPYVRWSVLECLLAGNVAYKAIDILLDFSLGLAGADILYS